MALESVPAILLAIAFLVPGFVLSSVLATTFRRRARSASDLTLQDLTFSCLNYGLWSWLIVLMIHGDWLRDSPGFSSLIAFVVLFASPVALGLLAARLSRREAVRGLLSALGFRVHRFIPTAWDFKFSEERPAWVIVRLKDGSCVFGFWGEDSFAGDEPGERDLFLQAVFMPSDSGHWQPVPDTGGRLIHADEIATVEFRRIDSTPGGLE
jgi:hypothetical protein